jgi:hypothetical protein
MPETGPHEGFAVQQVGATENQANPLKRKILQNFPAFDAF